MLRALILSMGLLIAAAVPTSAQNAPAVLVRVADKAALDELFESLKAAKDESAAQEITGRIWHEWFKTDNADVKQLMVGVRLAQSAGLMDEALRGLDKVVQVAPDYVEGWNQRATILFILGRDEESVRDIQQVLRLEPRHFGALAGLGLIHMRSENWASAIASFERALALHPFLGERAFIPELKKKLEGTKL